MDEKKQESLSTSEAARIMGRVGGKSLLVKYGRGHFSEIGKKGMASRWGKTKTRHGYDFYVAVGKKGALRRWGKTDKT